MRKKTKYLTRYTKNQDRDISTSATTLLQASLSCKLYRSIHNLPLAKFITCICDEDLTALIIEGNATDKELHAAWESLYAEYVDALKDDNLQYIDKLTKDYNLLITKCNVVSLLISAANYVPVDYLITELKRWYELPIMLDPKDKIGFKKDLALINARNMRWFNDALQIKKQIEQLQPVQNDNVKIDRMWFDQQIVALSRYSKYHINKNETTVSEFVVMIKDLQETSKNLLTQYSKN